MAAAVLLWSRRRLLDTPQDGLPVCHGSFGSGAEQPTGADAHLPQPPESGHPLLHSLEPVPHDVYIASHANSQANTEGFHLPDVLDEYARFFPQLFHHLSKSVRSGRHQ